MIPSLSPEADRELSDSSIFYAREANAEVGLAFILEYERALALLCANPNLDAPPMSTRPFETAPVVGTATTDATTLWTWPRGRVK